MISMDMSNIVVATELAYKAAQSYALSRINIKEYPIFEEWSDKNAEVLFKMTNNVIDCMNSQESYSKMVISTYNIYKQYDKSACDWDILNSREKTLFMIYVNFVHAFFYFNFSEEL